MADCIRMYIYRGSSVSVEQRTRSILSVILDLLYRVAARQHATATNRSALSVTASIKGHDIRNMGRHGRRWIRWCSLDRHQRRLYIHARVRLPACTVPLPPPRWVPSQGRDRIRVDAALFSIGVLHERRPYALLASFASSDPDRILRAFPRE